MKFGVVSDTHDNTKYVETAVDVFTGTVDAVVHCGDVVAPFSATPFDAEFEFYCVRGNNDGEWALADVIDDFGTYLGEFGTLEFEGARVGAYHGTSEPLVDALVESGSYDYVLRGHTHERTHEEQGETVHLNPGGIPIPDAEDAPAAVIVDTSTDEIEFVSLG